MSFVLVPQVRFIREVGVGGVAVWYIDEDDFGGTFCHLGSYPLLKLVSKELLTKQCVYFSTSFS